MADYNQLKNAAILTPTTTTDLGSDANRYSNVYMSGNIVMSNGVTVTSTNAVAPRIISLALPGTETAVDIAGGETISIIGSGFTNVGGTPSVLIGSTSALSVTYISSTNISFVTPVLSAGTYTVYIINSDGATATYAPGISFSGTPTWTTAAGSLGNMGSNVSVNLSVAATGDAPITYAIKAGSSLPGTLSLNTSTGAITGTAPTFASATTYNFTITAKDGQNQLTDRSFSINGVLIPSTVDYLVVAGGGGGGGYYYAGGGGAGGLLSATGFSISPNTYTVTIGAGGPGGAPSANGVNGGNSVFSSITCYGGGGGGGGGNRPAPNGGSGGGAMSDQVNAGGKGVYPGSTYIDGPRQGYDGGASSSGASVGSSGGGGGAGGVGGAGVYMYTAGPGGIGSLQTLTTSFIGTATTNSTTTLNITAVIAGEIQVGTQVTGTGIPAGAYVKSLGTGTGGTGTYILNAGTGSGSGIAITSSGRYFAGGGGGQSLQGGAGGAGGAGGGGTGGYISGGTGFAAVSGATNTGGGGGAAVHASYPPSEIPGAGGSGVVVIRHSDTFTTFSTTGSPTITTAGGYRIYKWTSSGTITF